MYAHYLLYIYIIYIYRYIDITYSLLIQMYATTFCQSPANSESHSGIKLELPATDICGAVSLRMRQTSELHLPLLSMPYSGRRCGICKEHSTTDKAVSQNLVCGIMYKNYVTYMYLYIYM